MSWWSRNISEPFQSAASAVGQAASYAVTYTGAAVAVVGGAALDVVDLGVNAAGYVAGRDWDLYEGSATVDAGKFIVDGRANNLANYIYENPAHAGHVALEGVQQGIGSAAGTVVGGVAAAGGLVVDGVNWTLPNSLKLHDGGFSATSAAFNGASGFVKNGIVDGSDYILLNTIGMEDPTMRNENDRIIFGATKGVTEVAASIAVVAATGGTGAVLLTGNMARGATLAKTLTTGSVNSLTAAGLTTAGAGVGILSNIDEQAKILEQRRELLEKMFTTPDGTEAETRIPQAGPRTLAFGN